MARPDDFRARLRIDKRRLDQELAEQAATLESIGRATAAAARKVAEVKLGLETLEARLLSDLTQDKATPMNKASVLIAQRREFQEATQRLIDAKHDLAEWEALEKAWYNRGFDLKALVELFQSQFYGETQAASVDVDKLRGAIREQSRSIDRRGYIPDGKGRSRTHLDP